jgi:hypothetical protein
MLFVAWDSMRTCLIERLAIAGDGDGGADSVFMQHLLGPHPKYKANRLQIDIMVDRKYLN